jgi:hypothetical protein
MKIYPILAYVILRHDNVLFRNDSALAAVQRLRHLRSAFELRQEWHYNNFVRMTVCGF